MMPLPVFVLLSTMMMSKATRWLEELRAREHRRQNRAAEERIVLKLISQKYNIAVISILSMPEHSKNAQRSQREFCRVLPSFGHFSRSYAGRLGNKIKDWLGECGRSDRTFVAAHRPAERRN